MIISASRRTDIPAFYADWFAQRIREGFCMVPNPDDPSQVATVSLDPSDVEVIVFWTKNIRPLIKHFDLLDDYGFKYYALFTINDYPREFEPKTPSLSDAIESFQHSSSRLGPGRLIWRYDPLIFTDRTPPEYHAEKFSAIANLLAGYTYQVKTSVIHRYCGVNDRLQRLIAQGINEIECKPYSPAFDKLMNSLVQSASKCGIQVTSCAEPLDLSKYGISHGKCVDDELIRREFNFDVAGHRGNTSRKACRCISCKDIGIYNTCKFNCTYCFATTDEEAVRANCTRHNKQSPILVGD